MYFSLYDFGFLAPSAVNVSVVIKATRQEIFNNSTLSHALCALLNDYPWKQRQILANNVLRQMSSEEPELNEGKNIKEIMWDRLFIAREDELYVHCNECVQ